MDALEDEFVEQHLLALAGWDLAVAAAQQRAAGAAKAQERPLYGMSRGMNG